MDAIGAHAPEPDDRSLFESIVANLDESSIEQAAATTESEQESAPTTREGPAAPLPVPGSGVDRSQTETPSTSLAPVISAPVPEPPPSLPSPVKPERPALVEPTRPRRPDLGRVEQTGHVASLAGYALSVGVGAFGQIMFFGEWLGATIPAPWNWVAAAIGAAFAEIGMIGAGNSSLAKRRDGGSWKLLLGVACFVCAGAVTMQVAHWLPKGFGVALVFGLASFVGFLIHMVIEHSKIRDYEDRKAAYAAEMAAYAAEQQTRYEDDLAAYQAEQQRHRRQVEQATTKKVTEAPSPSRPAAKAPAKQQVGGRATKADALRIGVEQNAATPAKLRHALTGAGYALPASSTTVENWCREIKAALAQ